ncbi:hypothetical protein HY638_01335 [Candidatus Woesearchaeota archaeon]|nr:hypothetical protein [Candidatus Woesearchaeota archaeon]
MYSATSKELAKGGKWREITVRMYSKNRKLIITIALLFTAVFILIILANWYDFVGKAAPPPVKPQTISWDKQRVRIDFTDSNGITFIDYDASVGKYRISYTLSNQEQTKTKEELTAYLNSLQNIKTINLYQGSEMLGGYDPDESKKLISKSAPSAPTEPAATVKSREVSLPSSQSIQIKKVKDLIKGEIVNTDKGLKQVKSVELSRVTQSSASGITTTSYYVVSFEDGSFQNFKTDATIRVGPEAKPSHVARAPVNLASNVVNLEVDASELKVGDVVYTAGGEKTISGVEIDAFLTRLTYEGGGQEVYFSWRDLNIRRLEPFTQQPTAPAAAPAPQAPAGAQQPTAPAGGAPAAPEVSTQAKPALKPGEKEWYRKGGDKVAFTGTEKGFKEFLTQQRLKEGDFEIRESPTQGSQLSAGELPGGGYGLKDEQGKWLRDGKGDLVSFSAEAEAETQAKFKNSFYGLKKKEKNLQEATNVFYGGDRLPVAKSGKDYYVLKGGSLQKLDGDDFVYTSDTLSDGILLEHLYKEGDNPYEIRIWNGENGENSRHIPFLPEEYAALKIDEKSDKISFDEAVNELRIKRANEEETVITSGLPYKGNQNSLKYLTLDKEGRFVREEWFYWTGGGFNNLAHDLRDTKIEKTSDTTTRKTETTSTTITDLTTNKQTKEETKKITETTKDSADPTKVVSETIREYHNNVLTEKRESSYGKYGFEGAVIKKWFEGGSTYKGVETVEYDENGKEKSREFEGTYYKPDGSFFALEGIEGECNKNNPDQCVLITSEKEILCQGSCTKELLEKAQSKLTKSKHAGYLNWMVGLLEAGQRPGVGALTSLVIPDDTFSRWKENVDKVLCDTGIFGQECWESKICSVYVDSPPAGSMFVVTPGGLAYAAAHIEGERTNEIPFKGTESQLDAYVRGETNETPAVEPLEGEEIETQKMYFYKITFNVQNPENSGMNMAFNVRISGAGGTKMLYAQSLIAKPGKSLGRSGKTPIVQYSKKLYDKACIVFDSEISIATARKKEVCNEIKPYGGTATDYISKEEREARTSAQGDVQNEADF